MSAPHRLLQKQLARAGYGEGRLDIEHLIKAVSATYEDLDRDRRRTDRSISLMVEELSALTGDLERKFETRTAELQETRRLLAATLDSVDQGILMLDAEQRVTVFNRRAAELLGLRPDVFAERPRFAIVFAHHRADGAFEGETAVASEEALFAQTPARFEWRRRDGLLLEMRRFAVGEIGCVWTYADITEQRKREKQLEDAEAEYRGLFENSVAGIYRTTPDGQQLRANPALVRLNGFSSEADMLAEVSDIERQWYVDPGRRLAFREAIERDGRVDDFVSEIYRYRTRERIWISETAWRVCDAQGRTLYYEGTVTDCTERVRAEARLAYLAHNDPLTGAMARSAFLHAMEAMLKGGEPIAAHLVDLDHFKTVNDTLGHPAGDKLLRIATHRLLATIGPNCALARLGGDEFAVLQPGVVDPEEARALAERCIAEMARPFDLDGVKAHIGASIGVVLAPQHGDAPEQLMKYADIALYRAKASGRSSVRLFDLDMAVDMLRRRSLEAELRGAAGRGELEAHLQPIVDIETGAAVGYEALMRWRHPEHGLLGPDLFVPIAEESGLIVPIGAWMLETACAMMAEAPGKLYISVNLSPVQFRARSVVETVERALAASGLPPSRLMIEITESVLLVDDESTNESLHRLRALGVLVALDDFGAGYSSLGYLRRFRFDVLKIDRAFIASGSEDEVAGILLGAILNLGRELGIQVVAEGVETEAQRARLRAGGARVAQGYLFGKPLPAESYLGRPAEPSWRSAS